MTPEAIALHQLDNFDAKVHSLHARHPRGSQLAVGVDAVQPVAATPALQGRDGGWSGIQRRADGGRGLAAGGACHERRMRSGWPWHSNCLAKLRCACFWHSDPNLVITEELIPFVIMGLGDHGGRSGFVRSADLKVKPTTPW